MPPPAFATMQKLSLCKGMAGDGGWAGLMHPVTDGMRRLPKKVGRDGLSLWILDARLCVPAIGNAPSLSSPTAWEGLSTALGARGTPTACRPASLPLFLFCSAWSSSGLAHTGGGAHPWAAAHRYNPSSIAGLLGGFILSPCQCRTRPEGKSQTAEQFVPRPGAPSQGRRACLLRGGPQDCPRGGEAWGLRPPAMSALPPQEGHSLPLVLGLLI